MKRILLSLGVVLLSASLSMAQDKKTTVATKPAAATAAPATTEAPKTSLTVDNMAFNIDSHDFGTVSEGPAAEYEFHFKNTGKEPINLQRVQASCGCTTPTYSKDPVLPGKEGVIKASYNTSGRPGPFTKSITVVSNAGTKVLTIKGTVEKAPTTSVPENSSMIKTN